MALLTAQFFTGMGGESMISRPPGASPRRLRHHRRRIIGEMEMVRRPSVSWL
jgi:hypothetical protein